jgi:flagellar basal body-associated protein FliL
MAKDDVSSSLSELRDQLAGWCRTHACDDLSSPKVAPAMSSVSSVPSIKVKNVCSSPASSSTSQIIGIAVLFVLSMSLVFTITYILMRNEKQKNKLKSPYDT